MMDRVETTILRNLIHDEEYLRKVIPFIQPDYFDSHQDRVIFEEIAQFIVKYNKPVSQEILKIEVENRSDINDEEFKEKSVTFAFKNYRPLPTLGPGLPFFS